MFYVSLSLAYSHNLALLKQSSVNTTDQISIRSAPSTLSTVQTVSVLVLSVANDSQNQSYTVLSPDVSVQSAADLSDVCVLTLCAVTGTTLAASTISLCLQ